MCRYSYFTASVAYCDKSERLGELHNSLPLEGDVQMEVKAIQQIIENIKANLQEVEVIKKYEGDKKVIKYTFNVYNPFIESHSLL